MPGPLDGIRVIDLSTIYSGPICGSILGDQGADVIKVESPEGDWMRTPRQYERNGVGAAFAMMNRNKRAIVIDVKTDEGRRILEKLVREADVLLENFRPGVMERLGIGYDALKAVNPRLIFASINGMGHTGPYARRRVYDAVIQAVSGVGSLQADPREDKPILVNTLVCDKLTSMTAAQAITAALLTRERTGTGQRVDVSMLESALFFMWPDSMLPFSLVGDERPYVFNPTHERFIRPTADGYICTMPVQADEWAGIFRSAELPNLLEDESYHTGDGLDLPKIQATVNDAFTQFTTAALARRLEENEVPFAIVNARDRVIDDPQVKALGSILEFDHPIAGPMRQARPPARFSETPAALSRCSPEHGEHTREVLQEIGFSEEEIVDLRRRDIVK